MRKLFTILFLMITLVAPLAFWRFPLYIKGVGRKTTKPLTYNYASGFSFFLYPDLTF